MNTNELSGMLVPDLMARFTASALGQYRADMNFDMKSIKKCVYELRDITAELKARPGELTSRYVALVA